MKLLEIWGKGITTKGKDLLIVSECLKNTFPAAYKKFAEGKLVCTACPDSETALAIVGKLACILKCGPPKSLTVLTLESSPGCYALQAAANEAVFISGARIKKSHRIVTLDGGVKEISADAIRISRYPSLVDELIRKNPEILKKLEKRSLEYRCALLL